MNKVFLIVAIVASFVFSDQTISFTITNEQAARLVAATVGLHPIPKIQVVDSILVDTIYNGDSATIVQDTIWGYEDQYTPAVWTRLYYFKYMKQSVLSWIGRLWNR